MRVKGENGQITGMGWDEAQAALAAGSVEVAEGEHVSQEDREKMEAEGIYPNGDPIGSGANPGTGMADPGKGQTPDSASTAEGGEAAPADDGAEGKHKDGAKASRAKG